jgi:hypothetical protein
LELGATTALSLGDAASVVNAVEETLFEHDHVSALLLLSSWCGKTSPLYEDHGGYQVFQRQDFALWMDTGIVVKNRYSRFPFREDLIRPLVDAMD